MTSFKFIISDVTSEMYGCRTLCDSIKSKFPALNISRASYDENEHSSVYIYYSPEENTMQIEGSYVKSPKGPDVVSYRNTIRSSALNSYDFVIRWMEHIRENHNQTESYDVF